jgi:hypothetical protein
MEPMGELGVARVETRFDRGGYYASSSGSSRYVPLWSRDQADGLAVGVGLETRYLVAPHLSVGLAAAHWNFSMPATGPTFPSVFTMASLRWER